VTTNGSSDGTRSETRAPEAIIDDLKSVIARSISGNVEVAGRLRALVQAMVNDPPSASAALHDPRSGVSKWLDFNVTTLRVLTEHALGALNGIVTEAELSLLGDRRNAPPSVRSNGTAPVETSGAGPATPSAVEIILRGAHGERASSPFLVENHYDRAVDVTFERIGFGDERRQIPASALQVEPARATLAARGQAIVYLAVTIDDSFEAGTSYFGAIRMVGFDARPVRVRLDVAERAAEPSRPPSAAPVTQRRKRAPRRATTTTP